MELPGTSSPLEPLGRGRGYVDHVTPADATAGANLTVPLDPTYLFRPLSVRFTVSTDANVANRFPSVDYCDPEGNVWVRNAAGLVLTNGTSGQVFDFNAQRTVAEWASNTDVLAPLSDFFIPGGWKLVIRLSNIQAGDTITACRFYHEKWVTGSDRELGGALAAGASRRRGR